ncbi:hypothetical protein FOA52_016169 [Chlamydomonas sp. UWO 241]|nr:hypothetical protein FOA52_016169 [Chlamydomonas sp. UWO 241]
MSVACDVGQSAELELELGLVVVDGYGDGEEMHAVEALQAKVGDLEQQVNAMKVQQLLVQLQQDDAQQRMAEQLERMQQQLECISVEMKRHRLVDAPAARLHWAVEHAEEGSFRCFDGGPPRTSSHFVTEVLQASIRGEHIFIPNNHHCDWAPWWGKDEYEQSREDFRDALTQQLHWLTGMKPSLVQKSNETGELLWVMEPLR